LRLIGSIVLAVIIGFIVQTNVKNLFHHTPKQLSGVQVVNKIDPNTRRQFCALLGTYPDPQKLYPAFAQYWASWVPQQPADVQSEAPSAHDMFEAMVTTCKTDPNQTG
jgi:hypothetical protein